MADTKISNLPNEPTQSDDLQIVVVERTQAGPPAVYETNRQTLRVALSGRATTDLGNVLSTLTPQQQAAIRTKIGAHEAGATTGAGTIDFSNLAANLRDAVEKSVAVGGISLSAFDLEFVSDDGTITTITLPRELPVPRVDRGGWIAALNSGGTAYVLIQTIPAARLPAVSTTQPGIMSAADKTKLDGVAAGAEVNVNADWNAASGDAQILNKPAIPTLDDDAILDLAQPSRSAADRGKVVAASATNENELVLADAGDALTDDAVLDLAQETRSAADRGKVLGVSETDENALVLADAGGIARTTIVDGATIPTMANPSVTLTIAQNTAFRNALASAPRGSRIIYHFLDVAGTGEHRETDQDEFSTVEVWWPGGGINTATDDFEFSITNTLRDSRVINVRWRQVIGAAGSTGTLSAVGANTGWNRVSIYIEQPGASAAPPASSALFSAVEVARLKEVLHEVADDGGWADGGGEVGNAYFTTAPTLAQAQAATYSARWAATDQTAPQFVVIRVLLDAEPMAMAGDLRWVISTADDPRAVDQRSTNWTRLGADATYAYYRSGSFSAEAGTLHVEEFMELRWDGDLRPDLKAPPVLDADIPTTLPRAPGSSTSPPSQRAVTEAFDASLTDGAQAWGPERDYTPAASLAALADGQYWRNSDRELVIDPLFGDRTLLLAASAIQIAGADYSAGITAFGDAQVHKRVTPPAVGQGTEVLSISAQTGQVRIETSDPPQVGDIVSFMGIRRGGAAVDTLYRVISRGSNFFFVREGTLLTEDPGGGRWFLRDASQFAAVNREITAVARVAALQPGVVGWRLTIGTAHGLGVGDAVSITGLTGIASTTVYPVRAQTANTITIADPAASVTIDTTHAVRLSIHVGRDLPAALPNPAGIRYPDRLITERSVQAAAGGAVGQTDSRLSVQVQAWGRFASQAAALAGVSAARWTNSGPGAAPTGAYWNLADVPAGSANLWLLQAQARPVQGDGTAWTFGAWGAVQAEGGDQPNVQFSEDVSPRVWHNTYSASRVWMRDWNPLAQQWGGERRVAQADAVGAWTRICGGLINWTGRWDGASFALTSEQDLRTWNDCRIHLAQYSSTGTHLRRGSTYLPLSPNVIAAPYAQRDGAAPLYQLASSIVVWCVDAGCDAIMANSLRGTFCFKWIRPSSDDHNLTDRIRVYEAEPNVRTYFALYVR